MSRTLSGTGGDKTVFGTQQEEESLKLTLEGYVTQEVFVEVLQDYALDEDLAGKQDAGDYATRSELREGLDSKQPAGSYATTSDLEGKQDRGSYATTMDLETGLAGKQAAGAYATPDDLSAVARDLEGDLGLLRTDLDANIVKADTAIMRVDQVEEEVVTQGSQIRTLETDMGTTRASVADLQSDVAVDAARVDALETAQGTRISLVEAQVGAHGTRLDQADLTLQHLDGRTDALESSSAAYATRLDAVEPRVTSVEGKADANASMLSTLGPRVGETETRIGQLGAQATAADMNINLNANAIASVTTRVTTAETNVGANTTAIATNTGKVGALDAIVTKGATGINLPATANANGPIITKPFFPASSGALATGTVGRCGLFMEPNSVRLGLASATTRTCGFAGYNADSSFVDVFNVDTLNGNGTFKGTVAAAAPTADTHLTTKAYVDGKVVSGDFVTNVDGAAARRIQNQSAGANAYVALNLHNDQVPGVSMFLNSSTRSTDGGSNCTTIRNDVGSLRLQSKGSKGLTVNANTGDIATDGKINMNGYTSLNMNGGNVGTHMFTAWNTLGEGMHLACNAVNNNSAWTVDNPAWGTSRLHFQPGSINFTFGTAGQNPTSERFYVNNDGAWCGNAFTTELFGSNLFVRRRGADGTDLRNSAGGGIWLRAPDNNAGIGIDGTGTARNTGNIVNGGTCTATGHPTASDQRLKSNIRTYTGAMAAVKKMRGVRYVLNSTKKESVGLIAQELETVVPEVVNAVDGDFKTVTYGNLVGVLVEAIKENDARLTRLENKLLSFL